MSAHDITKFRLGTDTVGTIPQTGSSGLAFLALDDCTLQWPSAVIPAVDAIQRFAFTATQVLPNFKTPKNSHGPPTIAHRRFSSGATHLSLVPVITTLRLRAACNP
ncbi:hypothetical protein CGRA01v4_14929 [Colletotrichum graminicola]|nr:hypothetical protein CGRA01v4_14929 [Colletotrichum graminicola]